MHLMIRDSLRMLPAPRLWNIYATRRRRQPLLPPSPEPLRNPWVPLYATHPRTPHNVAIRAIPKAFEENNKSDPKPARRTAAGHVESGESSVTRLVHNAADASGYRKIATMVTNGNSSISAYARDDNFDTTALLAVHH